ncbi:MAG: hypothetical protein AAF086_10100 [Planctomycetota bacterium]
MKALLIAFVVVGAIVVAVVKFGGVMDFDPAAQADEFRAMAVPGADWTALVEKAKPQEYMAIGADPDGFALATGMPIKYRPDSFGENVADGHFPDGFVLRWNFAAGDVMDLEFGGDGKLKGASEPITTQDLLDGTAVQKMQDMN